MKRYLLLSLLLFCHLAWSQQMPSGKTICGYVDPLIGTQEMGHTFPGATVPFGKVKLDD